MKLKIFVWTSSFNLLCVLSVCQAQIHQLDNNGDTTTEAPESVSSCIFTVVESMPENLTFAPGQPLHVSTYSAHKRLLAKATQSIHLTSFYWTLLGTDTEVHDYSSFEGEDIYAELSTIVLNGTVEVKIVQNVTNNNTDNLALAGAQVRTLDFQRLLHAGVLHTKMWIVDKLHVYIGSANFDWRSYTQVKELGVLIENCPTLAADADKLFDVYWHFSNPSQPGLLDSSLASYSTNINASNPHQVTYNQTKALVYLSSSPPPFCADGRSGDIDAILSVIRAAKEFVYISVMDYLPLIVYSMPQVYWPVIDDELRRAVIDRKVVVRLLASKWVHTKRDMYAFLNSLNVLKNATSLKVNIQVKLFTVPAFTAIQRDIPFSRVGHSKYMVTDQDAYIGTSNWSGDYFTSTGGVGFILHETDDGGLRSQLVNIFNRDWNSSYARDVY
ncbi:phospholipase D3 [Biomphalaria glabrata]|nr:phospholipase D3 [Biomphalaria glabrata]KAI8734933.1 phospholipase D3-like [Biomphalaria glabrata]KAI8744464.1 phospholipase D3 [Biomphalaria glabrata]